MSGVAMPRRAWLAFLLSLAAPGLGHLYAGSLASALGALVAASASFLFAAALFVVPVGEPWAPALGTMLAVATPFAVATDASRAARRGRPLLARRWLRVLVYFAFWLASGSAISEVVQRVREDAAQPFRIPSANMFPTLRVGDYVYANKWVLRRRAPQRGDVVIVELARDADGALYDADARPDLPTQTFVSRIVGVPGDVVEMERGVLRVGSLVASQEARGEELEPLWGGNVHIFEERLGDATHMIGRIPGAASSDFARLKVLPESYFLLGDNRDNSYDSRRYGSVSRVHVLGVVTHLYFSRAPSGSVRWERIGRLVR